MNPESVPGHVQVLGLMELHLNTLRWMKTTDAPKGRNRPEPLAFLREKPQYTAMSVDELDAFMGRSFRN